MLDHCSESLVDLKGVHGEPFVHARMRQLRFFGFRSVGRFGTIHSRRGLGKRFGAKRRQR